MRIRTFLILFSAIPLVSRAATYAEDGPKTTYSIGSSRAPGQIDHVDLLLQASGDVSVKTGPKGEKTEKLPMSVSCHRDYDEKNLDLPTGTANTFRSVRYYNEATAKIKKGEITRNPVLRPERRLIVMEIDGPKVTPFSPTGPLDLDELELMIAAGDSLPIDRFLPTDKVAIGDKWKAPNDALADLLGLEEITFNGVDVSLTEATPAVARFELTGRVEGKLYGAVNQLDIKAKCRFDRATNRIDWFALRITQTRDIGVVEDGVDVTVLVQMKIERKESSENLADSALKDVTLRSTPELTKVVYSPPTGGWEVTHDRSWFLVDHFRDLDVFHRLDGGVDLALCKISLLPKVDPSKAVPLKKFQADIQEALGKNFGEFIEASRTSGGNDHTVDHVVVKGTDGDVPARWSYYIVTDREGRQVTFAFRVEEKRLEAFGQSDSPLVASVKFIEQKTSTAVSDSAPSKPDTVSK